VRVSLQLNLRSEQKSLSLDGNTNFHSKPPPLSLDGTRKHNRNQTSFHEKNIDSKEVGFRSTQDLLICTLIYSSKFCQTSSPTNNFPHTDFAVELQEQTLMLLSLSCIYIRQFSQRIRNIASVVTNILEISLFSF